MALLLWAPHIPPPLLSLRRTQFHCRARTATATTTTAVKKKKKKKDNDVAVVWFKHDLRTDDHTALISASQYRSIVPLYIFDHRIISRFSDETLELVLLALKDLKTSLKDQGTDLMIRFGGSETIVSQIVKQIVVSCYKLGFNQVGDIDVFAEEEVEFDLQRMISSVEESLSNLSLSQQGKPQIVLWQTPFYDIKNLKDLPAFYHDFKKLKYSPTTPLASPVLPQSDIDLDWGTLPTFDDVKRYMNGNTRKSNECLTSIKAISAKSVLMRGQFDRGKMPNDFIEDSRKSNLGEGNQTDLNSKQTKRKRLENSIFVSKKGDVIGGGTDTVLNALAAYLRYLERTSKDDWQEVHEQLRNAESRSGASFGALFRDALFLGIISRRRVHCEAIKYERERNAGFLSPFGYSTSTVAAAVDTVCSMEWYWLMALKGQKANERGYPIRIWRWNDYLIQYTVVGHEGPAVLLVHGFGAFLEHYRDNTYAIADSGNRVWTITLLGFGKSEKPNIMYTELMWAELLRDFIVDVMGEPAHLVGNSIGGYFVAVVAGLWPALAKSVVLINTAGSVIPGNSSIPSAEERRTTWAAWLGSRLLLFYLRSRIGSIVKNCYPTNTERADDWLINEMLRASHDPGVLVVLESVFNFNLGIPLNYLLEYFEGKVLIIQGMKDPLSKSEARLSMLREHCSGIVIKELDAGHCPHDERPEEVNCLIQEWIVTMERNLRPC